MVKIVQKISKKLLWKKIMILILKMNPKLIKIIKNCKKYEINGKQFNIFRK